MGVMELMSRLAQIKKIRRQKRTNKFVKKTIIHHENKLRKEFQELGMSKQETEEMIKQNRNETLKDFANWYTRDFEKEADWESFF